MDDLKGKKFRYKSKYGLSSWVGTIKDTFTTQNYSILDNGLFKTLSISVRSEESGQVYDLEDVMLVVHELEK